MSLAPAIPATTVDPSTSPAGAFTAPGLALASAEGLASTGAPCHAAVQQSIRSRGVLDLAFATRPDRATGQRTMIARSFQSGCLRMRQPRPDHPAEAPTAVLINTGGGIAGGDLLQQSIAWGQGTRATVTTQAAEKVYRTLAATARIETRLEVAAGASAEWLPQETILFDASRLARETRVLLADDATFLGVEALVLGRAAMGEALVSGSLSDRLRIWRGGRLVYADALVLDGEVQALVRRAAIAGGARGLAVIVCADPAAQRLLSPLRAALEGARGQAAASAWNGLVAVRCVAPCGESLRHDITLALGVLREGKPLPRVWRC